MKRIAPAFLLCWQWVVKKKTILDDIIDEETCKLDGWVCPCVTHMGIIYLFRWWEKAERRMDELRNDDDEDDERAGR